MINKKYFFLLSVFFVFGISMPALAEETDSYNTLSIALNNAQSACVGISEKLTDLKRMAGINTAVTAVGTVSGGVALGTGIAKARIDKQLSPELETAVDDNHQKAGNQTDLTTIPKLSGSSSGKSSTQSDQSKLEQKSKTLGDVRTGTMAVAGASNVVGAVIAAKETSQDDLESHIARCSEAVQGVSAAQMQVRSDDSDPDGVLLQRADTVISNCNMLDKIDLSDIIKKAKGAMISSAVGATTGIVGTVLSVLANKETVNNDNAQKVKSLNTGSNVLAGTTTVASASAVFFNATQIGTIKQMSAIAEECEGAF